MPENEMTIHNDTDNARDASELKKDQIFGQKTFENCLRIFALTTAYSTPDCVIKRVVGYSNCIHADTHYRDKILASTRNHLLRCHPRNCFPVFLQK